MKKTHIFGIIIIAVAIGVIISATGDASSYVNFTEARRMSESGVDKKIHVVGTLKRDSNNEVVGVEASPDMLSFRFVMLDENNVGYHLYDETRLLVTDPDYFLQNLRDLF